MRSQGLVVGDSDDRECPAE
jgi:hypothetical protein